MQIILENAQNAVHARMNAQTMQFYATVRGIESTPYMKNVGVEKDVAI